MIRRASLAFAVALLAASVATPQEIGKAKTAPQIFADVRDLINSGSLEVAADLMKDFLALNPTAQDYLDIEAKFGPTTFLKLRVIPRWYDDATRDKEFKDQVLAKVVAGSLAANEALLKDRKRIDKFVRNLGGPREEYGYAVQELKRSGDAVVPLMVDALRVPGEPEFRAGLLRAIVELGPETVPGFLAAAVGMDDELKLLLLGAIVKRADLLTLAGNADANAIPYLWYLSGLPKTEPSRLRDFAQERLKELYAAAYDGRKPEDELTRAARPLYERKAKFLGVDADRKRVKLWTMKSGEKVPSEQMVTVAQAEEHFGLQYLRWAIERNGQYEPALDLYLAFATERAVERSRFGSLAAADPNAFRLLAMAPTAALIRLLDGALAENRTALALGLAQGLGDRADAAAGNAEVAPGGTARPPVLVKALDYPDPRVQLAAALALVRIPNARHGAHGRIVDVLKRAVAPDAGAGTGKGKALVADPAMIRGDQVANLLRAIGYQVEVIGNGRELAKRIDRTADFDLVLIDRHIVDPTLADLLPQIRGNVNTARRPLMIVASPDARTQLGFESLLTRLAALIAATETIDTEIPAIPPVDRRKGLDEIERTRKAVVELRDRRLRLAYDLRLARLERLVGSTGIRQSEELKRRLGLRMPQLTMAALIAEYDLTPTSAPKMSRDFAQLTELIRRQTDLDATVQGLDTAGLVRLIQQLESVITKDLRPKFEAIRAKMDEESLALPPDNAVDPATAAALHKLARTYPGVSVIREPVSRVGFEQDVDAAMPNAAQRPRDPVEKSWAARAAVAALARLADGSVPGYDVKPATDALRGALMNDDLAPDAADALSHIPVASAQTDLVKTAANAARPAAVRGRAATGAVLSVQAFGRMASPEAVTMIGQAQAAEPELKSDIALLQGIFTAKPGDFAEALKAYQPSIPAAAKPKEAAPKPDEKPMEEKKDEKPKEEKPKEEKKEEKPPQ